MNTPTCNSCGKQIPDTMKRETFVFAGGKYHICNDCYTNPDYAVGETNIFGILSIPDSANSRGNNVE